MLVLPLGVALRATEDRIGVVALGKGNQRAFPVSSRVSDQLIDPFLQHRLRYIQRETQRRLRE